MWNLRKRRIEKRQAIEHAAKKIIFTADAVINSAEIGSQVTTLDIQEKARQLFNLELSDKEATLALVHRLKERGYLVNNQTMRSMDA